MTTTLTIATLLLSAATISAEAQPGKSNDSSTQNTNASQAVSDKPKKITDRSHPDYIRCRKEQVIGSRAKYRKVCMTNAEWKLAARKGNEGTREIIGSAQPGLNGAN